MTPFTLIKITDEDNFLGYEEIIILDQRLTRKLIHTALPHCVEGEVGKTLPGEVYEYEFLVIADGALQTLDCDCIGILEHCYKHQVQEEQEEPEEPHRRNQMDIQDFRKNELKAICRFIESAHLEELYQIIQEIRCCHDNLMVFDHETKHLFRIESISLNGDAIQLNRDDKEIGLI